MCRCSGSLGHVRCHLLLQTLGEAVVEEEELAVREQAAEQSIDAVAPQQDLEGKVSLVTTLRGLFNDQSYL